MEKLLLTDLWRLETIYQVSSDTVDRQEVIDFLRLQSHAWEEREETEDVSFMAELEKDEIFSEFVLAMMDKHYGLAADILLVYNSVSRSKA